MGLEKKTIEDYLSTIFILRENTEFGGDGVKSIDIARKLGVSKPSVHEVIGKLKKAGFILKKKRSAVFLSKKGLSEAKRAIHTKRVLGVFLVDFLGCDPSKIELDVHKLEHAFSEEMLERLDRKIGDPDICPHGKKIHV